MSILCFRRWACSCNNIQWWRYNQQQCWRWTTTERFQSQRSFVSRSLETKIRVWYKWTYSGISSLCPIKKTEKKLPPANDRFLFCEVRPWKYAADLRNQNYRNEIRRSRFLVHTFHQLWWRRFCQAERIDRKGHRVQRQHERSGHKRTRIQTGCRSIRSTDDWRVQQKSCSEVGRPFTK